MISEKKKEKTEPVKMFKRKGGLKAQHRHHQQGMESKC